MPRGRAESDLIGYTLVHDPIGDFNRGCFFNREAFHGDLDEGFWPTGSVWKAEVRDGSSFYVIVRGELMNPQRLAKYKGRVHRLGQDPLTDVDVWPDQSGW